MDFILLNIQESDVTMGPRFPVQWRTEWTSTAGMSSQTPRDSQLLWKATPGWISHNDALTTKECRAMANTKRRRMNSTRPKIRVLKRMFLPDHPPRKGFYRHLHRQSHRSCDAKTNFDVPAPLHRASSTWTSRPFRRPRQSSFGVFC